MCPEWEHTCTSLRDTNLSLYGSWNSPLSGWRGQGPGWWAQLLGSAQNRGFHDARDTTGSSTNTRSSLSAERERPHAFHQTALNPSINVFTCAIIFSLILPRNQCVGQIESHLPYCQHLYSQSGTGRCTWGNQPIPCILSASFGPRCVLNSHFFRREESWEEGKTKHGLTHKSRRLRKAISGKDSRGLGILWEKPLWNSPTKKKREQISQIKFQLWRI